MIIAMLVLLAVAFPSVLFIILRAQRREHALFAQLLEHHREERKADWERVDALIEALANSKGVAYVARGPSGELIQAPTYWGDPGRRYWDHSRPITDINKGKEEAD